MLIRKKTDILKGCIRWPGGHSQICKVARGLSLRIIRLAIDRRFTPTSVKQPEM